MIINIIYLLLFFFSFLFRKINDFGMEEEDFKKVQSYKTISDLYVI